MSDGPMFTIGMGAMTFSPVAGDPNETPTQRAERIFAAQDRWTEKDLPSASPVAVLADMARADPNFRTGALMQRVASNPELMPRAEMEPGPGEQPEPGGLIEDARATVAARQSRIGRTIG